MLDATQLTWLGIVPHRNQEFVRKSRHCVVVGTHAADSRWKQMQKWMPTTVKTLGSGKMEPELLKYDQSWQFRQTHDRAEYLKILGRSLRQG